MRISPDVADAHAGAAARAPLVARADRDDRVRRRATATRLRGRDRRARRHRRAASASCRRTSRPSAPTAPSTRERQDRAGGAGDERRGPQSAAVAGGAVAAAERRELARVQPQPIERVGERAARAIGSSSSGIVGVSSSGSSLRSPSRPRNPSRSSVTTAFRVRDRGRDGPIRRARAGVGAPSVDCSPCSRPRPTRATGSRSPTPRCPSTRCTAWATTPRPGAVVMLRRCRARSRRGPRRCARR